MANGDSFKDFNNFKRVLMGVVVLIVVGWLGWVSLCAVAADREVAVLKSTITYIKQDVQELKTDTKSVFGLVTAIRDDQIRRERRENRRR
ncbi:MAG: hypothetical protein WC637_00045 [Victivallales bacterium]|jgi:hypothetical protein